MANRSITCRPTQTARAAQWLDRESPQALVFAGRAARELLATGERARRRTVETREDLTAAALPTQTMPGGPELLPGVPATGFD